MVYRLPINSQIYLAMKNYFSNIAISLILVIFVDVAGAQGAYVGPNPQLRHRSQDSTVRGPHAQSQPAQVADSVNAGQCYTDSSGYYRRYDPSNPPQSGGSGSSGFFIETCASQCTQESGGQRKFVGCAGSGCSGTNITPCV